MSFCNPDQIYLEAIRCVLGTRANLWHWLCENHSEIAIEYEVFVTKNKNPYKPAIESVISKERED